MNPDSKKPLSVIEITRKIKSVLTSNQDFKDVYIKGEVSNCTYHASGHIYFSLKDLESVIKCSFFKGANVYYRGNKLKEGLEIIANGDISLFEKNGNYNLNVRSVTEVGSGNIFLEIEKLKNRLKEKGIFDPERKKPIPKIPKTLGIATSETGAAIEDIIKIAIANYPNLNILVAPCKVQGDDAPLSIVNAIELLNTPEFHVDVIIAGRGGGSYEDLMAFNDERVVIAFYNSKVPIISAVGHETDRVLSDLSADNTAHTPSAAAKLAVPEVDAIFQYIDEHESRIQRALENLIETSKLKHNRIITKQIFQNPQTLVSERKRDFEEKIHNLVLLGKQSLLQKKNDLQVKDKLKDAMSLFVKNAKHNFSLKSERLDHFSPLLTLKRGFSVVRDKDKRVIDSVSKVKVGQPLEIILSQGKLQAEIISIQKET